METPHLGLLRGHPRQKCSRYTTSLVQEYYHGKGPLILSPGCRLKEILLPLNSVYFQSDPEKGPLPKPTTGISVIQKTSYAVFPTFFLVFVSTLPPASMQPLWALQPLECFLSCFVPEHTDSIVGAVSICN